MIFVLAIKYKYFRENRLFWCLRDNFTAFLGCDRQDLTRDLGGTCHHKHDFAMA